MTYRLARRAAARGKLEEVLEKSRRDSQNMGMSAHPRGVILHNPGDDPTACNAWICHLSTVGCSRSDGYYSNLFTHYIVVKIKIKISTKELMSHASLITMTSSRFTGPY